MSNTINKDSVFNFRCQRHTHRRENAMVDWFLSQIDGGGRLTALMCNDLASSRTAFLHHNLDILSKLFFKDAQPADQIPDGLNERETCRKSAVKSRALLMAKHSTEFFTCSRARMPKNLEWTRCTLTGIRSYISHCVFHYALIREALIEDYRLAVHCLENSDFMRMFMCFCTMIVSQFGNRNAVRISHQMLLMDIYTIVG